jgi:pseudaminic acid biosynthesis-associated methylase
VHETSIFDFAVSAKHDLVLIKGVLIHLPPERLDEAYAKLFEASNRYILMAEYYNPHPVTVEYRGHTGKLFKRDFAGEFLDRYPTVRLVDYGFAYRRDPVWPQDDTTWFLLEKK